MRRYWILALASAAMFMTIVDLAIVNVALPNIARDLSLDQATLQWVVIGYSLAFGGLLLLAGRLSDIVGRRNVLLAGLSVFTAASLVAGFADTTGILLASRAVQGIGAALIVPAALAIVAAAFTDTKERNTALGIYGAIGGAAASVGVLGGGLLTDGPGWEWIFFINVPIGAVLIAAALVLLPGGRSEHSAGGFDPRGAIAVTGGLVAALYAVNRGAVDGWTATTTLTWAVIAVVALALFVWSELRSANPLVSRRLRSNRPALSANAVAMIGFGSFFGFIFLTTLLLQQQLGYSATRTGLAWLLTSVTAFVAAGFTGSVLAHKFSPRALLTVGLVILGVAVGLLAFIPAHPDFVTDIMPALLLAGIGGGIIGPSVQIAALTGVDARDFGGASGLVETSRELGGAIIIALVSTALISAGGVGPAFLDGLKSGYGVIVGTIVAGTVIALLGLRSKTKEPEPQILTLEQEIQSELTRKPELVSVG